jgi:hypothetical protein
MPQVKVPKQSLEGPVKVQPGMYRLRFDGFDQKLSKNQDSVNLNPVLKIINNSEHTDRKILFNLNSKAGWIILDFCHGLGVEMGGTEEDPELPGEFLPREETDWTKVKYSGPLLGQQMDVELAEVDSGKGDGKRYSNIKRIICAIPGCTKKHTENLL